MVAYNGSEPCSWYWSVGDLGYPHVNRAMYEPIYIVFLHGEQVKTMEAKIFTQDLLTDEPQTPTPGEHTQHSANTLNAISILCECNIMSTLNTRLAYFNLEWS